MRADSDDFRHQFESRSGEPLSYVALFLVIVIGVAIGNLLSNWITARIAAYQMEKAAAAATQFMSNELKRSNEAMQALTRKVQAEAEIKRSMDQRNRAASPLGQVLSRQCDDWRGAYQQFKSESAQIEMNRHCGRYATYVETGAQPKN